MNQTRPLPITNGALVLDAAILKEAHITDKARVIVQEGRITILPDKDIIQRRYREVVWGDQSSQSDRAVYRREQGSRI